jgi:hypothetical protein
MSARRPTSTAAGRSTCPAKQAGIPHRYERLEGWPHGLDLAQVVNDYVFERMLQFLQTHLQPRQSGASAQ